MPRRTRRIAPLAALALLVLPALLASTGDVAAQGDLTPRGPIRIVGDSGFTAENGVVSGTGRASDPYVVRGWAIDARSGHGVEIVGTRAHVRLQQLVVSDGGAVHDGIRLVDAENVTVTDAKLERNAAGVRAVRSHVAIFGTSANGGDVGFLFDGSVFDVRRSSADGKRHGLGQTLGAGRVLESGFTGGQAAVRAHGPLHLEDTRVGGSPVGVDAARALVTLSGVHARSVSDTFVLAGEGADVRVLLSDLEDTATVARSASPTARVNMTDSWLGPGGRARLEGTGAHGEPLAYPPRPLSHTRAWGGDASGARAHASYLPRDLALQWSRELGTGVVPRPGALLYADRAVFAVDAEGAVRSFAPGGAEGGLRLRTGDPTTTLALGSGRLFVAGGGHLRALDLVDLREAWSVELPGARGLVHVPTPDGGVVAVSAGNETHLHSAENGTYLGGHGFGADASPPAASRDGRLVVAATDGRIHVMTLGRSPGLATFDVGRGPLTTPVFTDGVVYLGAGRSLVAVSAPRPDQPSLGLRELWRRDLGDAVSAPAVKDGRVHVVAGATLVSLAAADGSELARLDVVPTKTLTVVDDRVLLAGDGWLLVVRPGVGIVDRVPAPPHPADAPVYGGEVLVLGTGGRLAAYGAARPPAEAPDLRVEGSTVVWSGVPRAATWQVFAKGSGEASWRLRATTVERTVDLAALDIADADDPFAVRVRALDLRGHAGPLSAPVVVHRGAALGEPPVALVTWRVRSPIPAAADGAANGTLTVWNNGTAEARVALVGTTTTAPFLAVPVEGTTRVVPPQGRLDLAFRLQVDPSASAGRYGATLRFTVDGAPRDVAVLVQWSPFPTPEYRLRFVGGVTVHPNGTATALLVAGNDGDAPGSLRIGLATTATTVRGAESTNGTWEVDLAPGHSIVRELRVSVLGAHAWTFSARVVEMEPEGRPTSELAASVASGVPAPTDEDATDDEPTEPPDSDPDVAGPVAGVTVQRGAFGGWLLEESTEDVFELRVRASADAWIALEVRERAGLVVEVLDGPQQAAAGEEVVFRVRVEAPVVPVLYRRATLGFDVVDGAGGRTSVDAPVVLHARVALPGTTTRETLLGAAGVAAGAAVALVVVGRENARWGLFGALLPLYTRIRRQEVLQHATRERIHALVEREPGVTLTTLGRELALAPGVLLHHLHTLEREGYLASRREGRNRRFYLPGAPRETIAPLMTVAEADFVGFVVRRPGLSQSELARALGMSRQLVNYHVKSLARRGLVRLVEDGRVSRVFPVEAPGGARPPP